MQIIWKEVVKSFFSLGFYGAQNISATKKKLEEYCEVKLWAELMDFVLLIPILSGLSLVGYTLDYSGFTNMLISWISIFLISFVVFIFFSFLLGALLLDNMNLKKIPFNCKIKILFFGSFALKWDPLDFLK